MVEEPPAAAGAAAAHAASPTLERPGASGDGCTMRVLVQNTFIEVVAEDPRCASFRRVRSAPAVLAPGTVEHEQGVQHDAAEAGCDAALGPLGPAARLFGILSSSAEGPDGTEHARDRTTVGPDGMEHAGDRTTVVVRNLPPSYTRDLLLELLDAHGFSGLYDFVYVPYEFGSSTSFGFGFVNLTGPEHAARFKAVFEGFSSWQAHCHSEASVGWSFTQGYEAHVDRFRNSPVMHEAMPDCCKPAVFEGGARVNFPPPTKRLPPLKRQRRRRKPSPRGAPAASAAEDELAPPAGSLARGSLLAAGLYPGAGGIPEPGPPPPAPRPERQGPQLGAAGAAALQAAAEAPDAGDDRRWAAPRRGAPGKSQAAPSWADLSECGPEGLLGPALCPGRKLRVRSPAGRPAPAAAAREDEHSESSTDAPSSRVPSEALLQEPSSSQLSSASDAAHRCPRRGRRAGRRAARSSAGAAPWSAGSILLPGLVALGSLDDGPLGSIVDEHEPP